MARVPVITILSSNYAGSHLLARMLGAHPACADVGELRNFRKLSARRGPNASGTETRFADDPLYAGFEALEADRWHRTLLERLRTEDPAIEVLVDNSKRLDWYARCRANPDLEVRPVHLLRDPRALARRWKRTFADPRSRRRIRLREAKRQWRRGLRVLGAPETGVYGWRWLRENTEFTEALARHAPDAPRLAYEELVADPRATLGRLMPALGLDFDPVQLDFASAPQYGTRKTEWGDGAPLRLDARWREDLDPVEIAAVEALAPIHDYLDRVGYRLTDDGLAPEGAASTRERGRSS